MEDDIWVTANEGLHQHLVWSRDSPCLFSLLVIYQYSKIKHAMRVEINFVSRTSLHGRTAEKRLLVSSSGAATKVQDLSSGTYPEDLQYILRRNGGTDEYRESSSFVTGAIEDMLVVADHLGYASHTIDSIEVFFEESSYTYDLRGTLKLADGTCFEKHFYSDSDQSDEDYLDAVVFDGHKFKVCITTRTVTNEGSLNG